MSKPILAYLIAAAATAHVDAASSDQVRTFAWQTLRVSNYKRADADLNGDRSKEVFLYATDQRFCASGGCTLFVLSPHKGSYRIVMRSTVTQLPIRLLATSSHGWRDVGVTVAGGGTSQAYVARLRFDGRRYPSNPSVAPSIPLKLPSGQVLLDE